MSITPAKSGIIMAVSKKSAGILAYRKTGDAIEVLLVHPGGPYYAKKDLGSWTIPKGEFAPDEEPLEAAKREFLEETGAVVSGDFTTLSPIVQKGGKTVYAWAIEHDIDTALFKSNTFDLEWPPKSGKYQAFPEGDKAAWFTIPEAEQKINIRQVPLIHELVKILEVAPVSPHK